VFLAMTGGQGALSLDPGRTEEQMTGAERAAVARLLPPLRVLQPQADELAAHRARLVAIAKRSGGKCVWLEQEDAAAAGPA